MEQRDFLRERTPEKVRKYVGWGVAGGIGYCVIALMSMFSDAGAVLDLLIAGSLTAGVHFKQSRACAMILLLMFVLNEFILALFAQFGILNWIVLVVISFLLVCGAIGTFEFQKLWKEYKRQKLQ